MLSLSLHFFLPFNPRLLVVDVIFLIKVPELRQACARMQETCSLPLSLLTNQTSSSDFLYRFSSKQFQSHLFCSVLCSKLTVFVFSVCKKFSIAGMDGRLLQPWGKLKVHVYHQHSRLHENQDGELVKDDRCELNVNGWSFPSTRSSPKQWGPPINPSCLQTDRHTHYVGQQQWIVWASDTTNLTLVVVNSVGMCKVVSDLPGPSYLIVVSVHSIRCSRLKSSMPFKIP